MNTDLGMRSAPWTQEECGIDSMSAVMPAYSEENNAGAMIEAVVATIVSLADDKMVFYM